MYKGIQHTCFITKNIDKCIEFYGKLPGIKIAIPLHLRDDDVIKKMTGYPDAKIKCVFMQVGEDDIRPANDNSAARIEFIEYVEPKGRQVELDLNDGGNSHICLYSDSIEEDRKKWQEMGLWVSPVVQINDEGEFKGLKLCYLKDPDKRIVELMQFPQN